MASNVPFVNQVSWVSVVYQTFILGAIVLVLTNLKIEEPFIVGALSFMTLALLLRNFVARDHRRGIRLVKKQMYSEAIPFFEKSVIFFNKNIWVDKYRYVTLLSSSKMSYKEMGLCNIAFCYSQTGNGLKAKEMYENIIKEFPSNGIALASLNLINSVETKS